MKKSQPGRQACFDYGQKLTEIGAGLAYAEFQLQRVPVVGGRAIIDLATGLNTAASAADRLGKDSAAGIKPKVQSLAREIRDFDGKVRARWLSGKSRTLKQTDLKEIQDRTAILRRKVTAIWQETRKTCSGGE